MLLIHNKFKTSGLNLCAAHLVFWSYFKCIWISIMPLLYISTFKVTRGTMADFHLTWYSIYIFTVIQLSLIYCQDVFSLHICLSGHLHSHCFIPKKKKKEGEREGGSGRQWKAKVIFKYAHKPGCILNLNEFEHYCGYLKHMAAPAGSQARTLSHLWITLSHLS